MGWDSGGCVARVSVFQKIATRSLTYLKKNWLFAFFGTGVVLVGVMVRLAGGLGWLSFGGWRGGGPGIADDNTLPGYVPPLHTRYPPS